MSPPPDKSKSSEGDDTTDICYSCKQTDCFVTAPRGQKQKISAPSWVHCDSCAEWFHAICQDMTDKDVASLRKLKDKPGVKWYCSPCNEEIDKAIKGNGSAKMVEVANNSIMKEKLSGIEHMVKKLTTAMDENQGKLEERLKNLEDSHGKAVESNIDSVKKAAQLNNDARVQFDQILDQQQAEYRKKNAIIYGVNPEMGKTAMEKVLQLMEDEAFAATPKPLTAKRLQTNSPSSGSKPGPVKLEFADEESKWAFVKRANAKLRTHEIYCKLDESKSVRDQQYKLRQQIKQMKEQDQTTQYRIRNMQIQTKASGDWEYLQPNKKSTALHSTV